jgi:hypothetical protein
MRKAVAKSRWRIDVSVNEGSASRRNRENISRLDDWACEERSDRNPSTWANKISFVISLTQNMIMNIEVNADFVPTM